MSSDQDEAFRIRPLDDKNDYSLCRLRVRAAISSKGLRRVLSPTGSEAMPTFVDTSSSTGTAMEKDKSEPTKASSKTAMDEQKEQAINIIISALGDHALLVVHTINDNP